MATKKKIHIPTLDEVRASNKPHYDMVVTAVQVFPFKSGANLGHIKGLAEVVINDALVIRGLRICDGENGMFVQYPVDPFYKGDEFRSIVFPMTRELREHIENVVLEKYQAAII